jgi:hypothetical protein
MYWNRSPLDGLPRTVRPPRMFPRSEEEQMSIILIANILMAWTILSGVTACVWAGFFTARQSPKRMGRYKAWELFDLMESSQETSGHHEAPQTVTGI